MPDVLGTVGLEYTSVDTVVKRCGQLLFSGTSHEIRERSKTLLRIDKQKRLSART